MDPDITVVLRCPPGAGLTQEQVQAELSTDHNRRPHPGHERRIAETWECRQRAQPWLFNGAKFRFHSAELRDGRLVLRLGLTCYRDYLGTNWSAEAPALQRWGLRDFGDSQAYLAEPLGVGAMLQTADSLFVFLRRSDRVAEAAGLVDVPGGHPEPKAAVKGVPEESIRLEHLSAELVVQELFASILGEIRDEVNIPLESLNRPLLLGIVRNNRSAGRASAEFYVRCKLTSEEVRQRYLIGGPEAQESTNIIFITQQDVLKMEEATSSWQELCPSAKGGVKLYSLVHAELG
ncbi:uridine diphosphate glucose pyrophosphatase NUDT22 [Pristis pectinata]|uniref:uridine diphosphate glucose pyrophosphatase NUDT22 n=1 Tax=Pristis pectinata TaxID=685728 RepID=UPI00223D37F5|nr:uridine diphosphate glucose pyrophosphatase NUDT22 [Pristis pectinata]XP_051901248.1 uridine diphosphate glucose pyrophosphatase NUDT22 [Pristis pectinata]XP_051901249.1 uridine diphosphate glucose pyrophosphatase NUDT22 [Pristis pectinata]